MPVTINHVLTATTPDNTSYEIRPSHWNSQHAITLNLSGTDVIGAFSNSNNVSFGTTPAGYITASASYSSPSTAGLLSAINVSAGTTSNNLSAVTFSNANGVTFGMNGSVITGSVAAAAGAQTGISGVVVSNTTYTSGTVTFQNANGISFGSSGANGISASYTVPSTAGLISRINISAGTTSNNLSALTVSNSNNVSFGLNGSVLTASASYSQSTQPVAASASNGSFAFSTLAFSNANNVTFGTSAGSIITASVAPGGGAGFTGGVSTGGNTSGNTGTQTGQFVLAGGNNITLCVSTAAGGAQTITISGAAAGGAQTAISGIVVSNTTYTSGTVTFQNANGISFGSSGANGISASYTVPSTAGLLSAIKISAGTTSNNLSAFTVSNSNNVSFGLNGSVLTASASYSQSTQPVAASASNGSFAFSTLAFSNANNVTFGTSAGSVITASVAGAGGAASATNYFTGNTTQSSSGTMPLSSQIFVGYGIVSVGQSNGSVLISSPNPVTATDMSVGISGGNTAGNTGTVANGQVVFAGGNNITLSGSTAGSNMTITISGGAGGGGGGIGMGVSTMGNTAGTTGTVTTGNVILVGSGPISLSQSSSGSNATISINAPATSSLIGGANITVSTNGSTISIIGASVAAAPLGISAGTVTNTYQTVTFSNSNNVSFGLGTGASAGVITASATLPAQTGISGIQVSNTTYSSGTVTFQNANGISFGSSGANGISASYTVPTQSTQPVAVSGSNGSFAFSTLTMGNLNGLSHYTSNGSIVGSYTVPSTAGLISAVNLSAGTTSSNASAFTFSNSNNVSFGLNGATVTASASFPAQTTQSAIKGLGVSNTGNTAGNTGLSTGIDWVVAGSNNITVSQSTAAGGPNTVWISGPSVAGAQTGISGIVVSNTTYTSGTVSFSNANGMSFGSGAGQAITASYTVPSVTQYFSNTATTFNGTNVSGSLTINTNGLRVDLSVAAGGAGDGYNILAAGTQTANTTGTVAFLNSNGISFGMSNSSQITASYTVPIVPTSYVSQVNGSTGQISFATGSSLSSSSNGSTITWGLASNITTALQSANANYLTSQSNQAFSASGGSSAFQTLNFANSNGMTFTNTNGSVAASYTVPSVTQYFSNTATGFTGANISGSITHNTNGLSLSLSVAAPGAGAVNFSAGTTSNNLASVVFSNSNGVSFGLNGSTITASAAGAGGNFSGGVSTLGNTAGSTGISGSQMVLVGSGVMSLSQSTGANGNTISILAPATSSLVGAQGISISTAGSTISVLNTIPANSRFVNEPSITQVGTVQGNSLVSIVPFVLQNQLDMSNLRFGASVAPQSTTNNSTNMAVVSASAVLYSLNGSTLSSFLSGSNSYTATWSSNATSSVGGVRAFTMDWANSTRLQPGEYWAAVHVSTATSAFNTSGTSNLTHAMSMLVGVSIGTAAAGMDHWGQATQATRGASIGLGLVSTGNTRGSIAVSQITQSGTRAMVAKLWLDMRNYSVW